MICHVYRSPRREGAYLYLPDGKIPEDLPDELRDLLAGGASFLEINLDTCRHLVQVEPADLVRELTERGYYLYLQDPGATGEIIGQWLRKSRPGAGGGDL